MPSAGWNSTRRKSVRNALLLAGRLCGTVYDDDDGDRVKLDAALHHVDSVEVDLAATKEPPNAIVVAGRPSRDEIKRRTEQRRAGGRQMMMQKRRAGLNGRDVPDAEALFRAGYRLAFSRPRVRNAHQRAVSCWKRAAARGHRRALFYLGSAYEHGKGVRRDIGEAMRFYRQAAVRGHAVAQYNLGFSYIHGDGARKNASIGVKWYRLAAGAGDPAAQRDLGYCLHEGVGVAVDYREAVGWYRRAAHQGDPKAQFNLGLCYLDGDGVRPNRRWARYWLERAARQKHPRSKVVLRKLAQDCM